MTTHTDTQYPRMALYRRKEWYGEAFDLVAFTGPSKKDRVCLGRHNSQEECQAVFDRWKETGEKPEKRLPQRKKGDGTFRVIPVKERFHAKVATRRDGRCRYIHVGSFGTKEEAEAALEHYRQTGERKLGNWPKKPRKEKPAVVTRPKKEKAEKPKPAKRERPRKTSVQVAETRSGKRWYVSGREQVNGKSVRVFVGTFENERDAENARNRFLTTGWKAKPKKRGPAVRLQDIKIAPGRNLRDHEVECLKRHRPELLGGDPRARRPDESVADWFRRLEVLKGYRAA